MQWDLMDPYSIHVVQVLIAATKQWRCEFCQDILQFVHHHPTMLNCLWFNDEAYFHLIGFVNNRSMRFWAS